MLVPPEPHQIHNFDVILFVNLSQHIQDQLHEFHTLCFWWWPTRSRTTAKASQATSLLHLQSLKYSKFNKLMWQYSRSLWRRENSMKKIKKISALYFLTHIDWFFEYHYWCKLTFNLRWHIQCHYFNCYIEPLHCYISLLILTSPHPESRTSPLYDTTRGDMVEYSQFKMVKSCSCKFPFFHKICKCSLALFCK